jgi:hypothetical protein
MIIAAALIMVMLAGSYLLLQNSGIQTIIIQKITHQLSLRSNAKITIGKVDFDFFNTFSLHDVLILGEENDTILFTSTVIAKIDTLKIQQKRIHFRDLLFYENSISVSRNDSNRLNVVSVFELFKNEKKDTVNFWSINCNQFNFDKSEFTYQNKTAENSKHLYFNKLNVNISDFYNYADSVAFKLNNLTLRHDSTLNVKKFAAEVYITKNKIRIDSLNIRTDNSEINNSSLLMQVGNNDSVFNRNMRFDVRFDKSTINVSELGLLIPSIHEIDETIEMSGRIYGNLNDLKGKDLLLRSGKRTSAAFDFYVNGIQDIETMYLFIDLKRLQTTMQDISNFEIISNGKNYSIRFPEQLYNAGLLTYTGNFSGFLSDFVSFGTLSSKMGIIKTDVSVIPKADGVYSYRGKITTRDFDLGNLLSMENVGNITFSGNVDGDYRLSLIHI